MNNKNYKIICEEIEQNNIILEDVISEGLIDSLKNMGKSALSGIANAANAMTEKFISGIASLFGKPKKDGSINKIDADSFHERTNCWNKETSIRFLIVAKRHITGERVKNR